MKARDLTSSEVVINKFYDLVRGKLKLQVRRILKPFLEEIKTINEVYVSMFKEAGAKPVGEKLQLEGLKKDNFETEIDFQKAVEERESYMKQIDEVGSSEVEITVSNPVSIEEVIDLDISNSEIDTLMDLGIIVDPEESESEEVK
jgi:hypothetical protein